MVVFFWKCITRIVVSKYSTDDGCTTTSYSHRSVEDKIDGWWSMGYFNSMAGWSTFEAGIAQKSLIKYRRGRYLCWVYLTPFKFLIVSLPVQYFVHGSHFSPSWVLRPWERVIDPTRAPLPLDTRLVVKKALGASSAQLLLQFLHQAGDAVSLQTMDQSQAMNRLTISQQSMPDVIIGMPHGYGNFCNI